LAEKIHKRIEHFRALIKEKGDEYREFLQEELKEFEILLYGKKGLRFKIEQLDKLLYGEKSY
jgi:hypothetical protein